VGREWNPPPRSAASLVALFQISDNHQGHGSCLLAEFLAIKIASTPEGPCQIQCPPIIAVPAGGISWRRLQCGPRAAAAPSRRAADAAVRAAW